MNEPMIVRSKPLSIQVCAPTHYTDDDVLEFAEGEMPCGTTAGWQIRRQGNGLLNGADERVACADRAGYVHIVLDA